MTDRRDEARRIAAEIRQAIEEYDGHLDGYMWGLHDNEHLRYLVMDNDVEALAAAQRVLLPLQQEFAPGFIGSMVRDIREQGVANAGELVTRESVTGWRALLRGIDEYGGSVGNPVITTDARAHEILLMAFTDPDIAVDEIISVMNERGLLPADAVRGLISERRSSVTALAGGVL